MQILDTDVLLRHLLQDDPVQSTQATRYIENELKRDGGLMIPDIAVAEAVWILKGRGFGHAEIATLLKPLIADDRFLLENRERLGEALVIFAHGRKFGDAYLSAATKDLGAEALVSFDRGFAGMNIPWIDPRL